MDADLDFWRDLLETVAIVLFLLKCFIFLPRFFSRFKKEDENVSS